MQDLRLGACIRALRQRHGWRQADLATRAHCSDSTVSRLERGRVGEVRVDTVRMVARALEMGIDLVPRWHGGDLDRLVNAGHATLSTAMTALLRGHDWLVVPEVSFSIWGERGSIDLLAWHPLRETLGVFELKTELADPLGLLAQVGRYGRLAPKLALERGWTPRQFGLWVVVADSSTNRRRAGRCAALLRATLPRDGRVLRAWIVDPADSATGLAFLSESRAETAIQRIWPRRRIRPAARGPRERERRMPDRQPDGTHGHRLDNGHGAGS